MEPKDKIAVIQTNIENLRQQLLDTIKLDSLLWQIFVGGVSATLILKDDTSLVRNHPVFPLLGLVIIILWLHRNASVFRLSHFIAAEESKISEIARNRR